MKISVFYIDWIKYNWEDFSYEEHNEATHYGIYQIYGNHPIYGKDCLLYIGKANKQTFGKRLAQHEDSDFWRLSEITHVHIGVIKKMADAKNENWDSAIDSIERILINAHMPSFNAASIKGWVQKEDANILVLNAGKFGSLMPTVAGLYYAEIGWTNYDAAKHLST